MNVTAVCWPPGKELEGKPNLDRNLIDLAGQKVGMFLTSLTTNTRDLSVYQKGVIFTGLFDTPIYPNAPTDLITNWLSLASIVYIQTAWSFKVLMTPFFLQ